MLRAFDLRYERGVILVRAVRCDSNRGRIWHIEGSRSGISVFPFDGRSRENLPR